MYLLSSVMIPSPFRFLFLSNSCPTITSLCYLTRLYVIERSRMGVRRKVNPSCPKSRPLPVLSSTNFTSLLSPLGDLLETCRAECVSTGAHLRNNQLKQLYSNSINVFKSTSYFPTGNPAKHTLQQTLK